MAGNTTQAAAFLQEELNKRHHPNIHFDTHTHEGMLEIKISGLEIDTKHRAQILARKHIEVVHAPRQYLPIDPAEIDAKLGERPGGLITNTKYSIQAPENQLKSASTGAINAALNIINDDLLNHQLWPLRIPGKSAKNEDIVRLGIKDDPENAGKAVATIQVKSNYLRDMRNMGDHFAEKSARKEAAHAPVLVAKPARADIRRIFDTTIAHDTTDKYGRQEFIFEAPDSDTDKVYTKLKAHFFPNGNGHKAEKNGHGSNGKLLIEIEKRGERQYIARFNVAPYGYDARQEAQSHTHKH